MKKKAIAWMKEAGFINSDANNWYLPLKPGYTRLEITFETAEEFFVEIYRNGDDTWTTVYHDNAADNPAALNHLQTLVQLLRKPW
jgi:hypothetical protein